MSQREKLLEEVVSCRSFILSQLADLAEEEGKINEAKAWRWFRDHRKWPAPRQSSGGKIKWGWNLIRSSIDVCAQKSRSATLMYDLYMCGFINHTLYITEKEALNKGIEAMTRWLSR